MRLLLVICGLCWAEALDAHHLDALPLSDVYDRQVTSSMNRPADPLSQNRRISGCSTCRKSPALPVHRYRDDRRTGQYQRLVRVPVMVVPRTAQQAPIQWLAGQLPRTTTRRLQSYVAKPRYHGNERRSLFVLHPAHQPVISRRRLHMTPKVNRQQRPTPSERRPVRYSKRRRSNASVADHRRSWLNSLRLPWMFGGSVVERRGGGRPQLLPVTNTVLDSTRRIDQRAAIASVAPDVREFTVTSQYKHNGPAKPGLVLDADATGSNKHAASVKQRGSRVVKDDGILYDANTDLQISIGDAATGKGFSLQPSSIQRGGWVPVTSL